MRFVIQRVQYASVAVEERIVGKINQGFLVLIGIEDSDTKELADRMIAKMIGLRIFEDADGKTNCNLASVNGSLLLVSQFTLYADCHHGNRPSFIRAGRPDFADALYEYIVARCQERVPVVEHGIFGADMKVDLRNDGPFTILLDSDEIFPRK